MERAIERYEQALAIARVIGAASTERSAEWTAARDNEGLWLGNLGLAYYNLGQADRAREYLKHALAIFEEIKSLYAEQARRQLAKLG